jgi:hypothetical protein
VSQIANKLLLGVIFAVILGGCAVRERRARPACRWVPAHYDYYGRFVPGHCR